jgi:hypothetical protein
MLQLFENSTSDGQGDLFPKPQMLTVFHRTAVKREIRLEAAPVDHRRYKGSLICLYVPLLNIWGRSNTIERGRVAVFVKRSPWPSPSRHNIFHNAANAFYPIPEMVENPRLRAKALVGCFVYKRVQGVKVQGFK